MISSILSRPIYSPPPEQPAASAPAPQTEPEPQPTTENKTGSDTSATNPTDGAGGAEKTAATQPAPSEAPATTAPKPQSPGEIVVSAQVAAEAEGGPDMSQLRREAEAARQSYLSDALISSVASAAEAKSPLTEIADRPKAETDAAVAPAASNANAARAAADADPASPNREPRGMDMTI